MFHLVRLAHSLLSVGLIASCFCACGADTGDGTPEIAPTSQDDSIRLVLEDIFDTDQGVREKLTNLGPPQVADGMIIFDSSQSVLMNQMMTIDSVNMERLLLILKEYGYPKMSRVGEKASDAAFYVIQHGDTALMGNYADTLDAFATQGEAKLIRAAMMRDRVLMYRNKKQIYGTQASSFFDPSVPEGMYIWPIADPDSVNVRRKRIGFEFTVEEVAEELDAVYKPDLALPAKPTP